VENTPYTEAAFVVRPLSGSGSGLLGISLFNLIHLCLLAILGLLIIS
jgi:hypothetical protein